MDETYDRADGAEPPRSHEHVLTHGMPRIRATLVRNGDTLRLETKSAERMDRMVAALFRLDPTRRGDLIKLLDSFPADDGAPGRMSVERLRSALGLE